MDGGVLREPDGHAAPVRRHTHAPERPAVREHAVDLLEAIVLHPAECRVDRLKANRSIPSATVIPVLIYPDVREAVEWLTQAFGFAERVQIGDSHRSQLRFGDGAVIAADVRHEQRPPRPGEVTHSVLVRVEDADAHCERARGHGARILMDPTDFEYGERQYAAEDPAGHRWTFSETLRDVAPEEWGGISAGGS